MNSVRVERDKSTIHRTKSVQKAGYLWALRLIGLTARLSVFTYSCLTILRSSQRNTYIGAVSVNCRGRNLQPEARDSHPERIADPSRPLSVADAYSLDDYTNGQQQRQPKGVEPRLRDPPPSVPPRESVDEPVGEPARVGLAEETAHQQRNAEHKARLHGVEAVLLAEDDGAGGREQHGAVAEASHVVQPWQKNSEVAQHQERLGEVAQLDAAAGAVSVAEEEQV
jgi:hypothetical protein